jgi:MFS family permease
MSFTIPCGGPASRGLHRNRAFALSTAARALSLLGDQVAVIVLVLRLHDDGQGGWAVAGLMAAGALPLLLMSPIAGLLADRVNSTPLLIATSSTQAAVCAVLAFSRSTPVVLVLVAGLSAAEAITSASWQALVPRIVGEDRIAAAVGLSRATMTAVAVVAPAAGGLLTAGYGPQLPLLLDAGSYLVVLGAAVLIRTRRDQATSNVRIGRAWDGFGFLRADPVLGPLVVGLLVFVVAGGTVNVVEVFLIRDTFHASDAWYGTVGALWLAGMVAGSVAGGRARGTQNLARAALCGCACLAIALGVIAIVPSVGWLPPVEIAGGVGNGLLTTATSALALSRAPQAIRGRVGAALSGAANAASLAALAVGGALATSLTPRGIFALAALATAVCTAATSIPITRAAARAARELREKDGSLTRPVGPQPDLLYLGKRARARSDGDRAAVDLIDK